jgi:nitrate/TMAO reductase-like tetraheme cytochrome c subunit
MMAKVAAIGRTDPDDGRGGLPTRAPGATAGRPPAGWRMARGVPALLALLAPAVAVAAAAEDVVPLPHGWIGTVEQWVRGMGIAFAALNLVVLWFAWRSLRPTGLTPPALTPTARGWLFVAVGLIPTTVALLSFVHGLESSSTVSSCGYCHVMKPYVEDLENVESDTLAATHYKNRYIQERHCFTCHSDYGLAGTISAKFGGVGHVVRYTTRAYTLPLEIASPYPNVRCLKCHAGAPKFVKSPAHPEAMMPELRSGSTSCLVCHGPAHPREEKKKEEKKVASR